MTENIEAERIDSRYPLRGEAKVIRSRTCRIAVPPELARTVPLASVKNDRWPVVPGVTGALMVYPSHVPSASVEDGRN